MAEPITTAMLLAEEAEVQFPSFDVDVAWRVGSLLRQQAFEGSMPVAIEVAMSGQRLSVVVRDDGVGGAREGFGLTSLRDRVGSVGGSLTLESPPGAGTSIRAEIPCAS